MNAQNLWAAFLLSTLLLGNQALLAEEEQPKSDKEQVQKDEAAAREASVSSATVASVEQMFAVVNASGSLDRHRRVLRVKRIAAGQYEVIFNRNVTNGAYVACLGNPGAGSPLSGSCQVARRAGNSLGVWVQTRDQNGTFADRPFHLIVLDP